MSHKSYPFYWLIFLLLVVSSKLTSLDNFFCNKILDTYMYLYVYETDFTHGPGRNIIFRSSYNSFKNWHSPTTVQGLPVSIADSPTVRGPRTVGAPARWAGVNFPRESNSHLRTSVWYSRNWIDNSYNDYRDSNLNLDLDWERFSDLVTQWHSWLLLKNCETWWHWGL